MCVSMNTYRPLKTHSHQASVKDMKVIWVRMTHTEHPRADHHLTNQSVAKESIPSATESSRRPHQIWFKHYFSSFFK